MSDKISVINFVWMAMIGSMLAVTVSLYDGRNVAMAKNHVTSVASYSHDFAQN